MNIDRLLDESDDNEVEQYMQEFLDNDEQLREDLLEFIRANYQDEYSSYINTFVLSQRSELFAQYLNES